jgi:rubrerythrin
MLDSQEGTKVGGDYIPFYAAGSHAKGQYRCAECGYGVTVHDELPTCPMCGGTSWELSAWTPFGNARNLQRRATTVL